MTLVNYENSLPYKIIFERQVTDISDGHWSVTVLNYNQKPIRGYILKDALASRLIMRLVGLVIKYL